MGKFRRERKRRIGEIFRSMEEPFGVRKSFKFGEALTGQGDAEEPIQRWFRYREGYSIGLVEQLIKGVPGEGLVVDPCCGTGTTLLAARKHDYRSIGMDTNPFATFTARVKTRNYSSKQQQELSALCRQMSYLSPNDLANEPPSLRRIERFFVQPVLHALLVIRSKIDSIGSETLRDFFLLAWLSILEELSSIRREGSLKYRRRRRLSSGGYEVLTLEDWQEMAYPADTFGHTRDMFLRRAEMMIGDLTLSPSLSRRNLSIPMIYEGNALSLNRWVGANSADVVIFSPPYLNTLNYINAYRIELWMGGFIKSYQDRQDLNCHSLRSHFEAPLKREDDNASAISPELDALIGLMDQDALWDPRIPQMIRGYFRDMARVLENALTVLKPGGRCILVVASSAYGNVVFPTDLLLATIGKEKGFTVQRIAVAREITTSSQQMRAVKSFRRYLRESILFLLKD